MKNNTHSFPSFSCFWRFLGPRIPSITVVLSLSINGGCNTLQGIIKSSWRRNCEAHCFTTCHEFEDWWSPPPNVATQGESTTTADTVVFVGGVDTAIAQSSASYEARHSEVRWLWSNWLDLQNHTIFQVSFHTRSRKVNHCFLLYGRTSTCMVPMDAS